MALRRTQFRFFPSTMTEFFSSVRCRMLAAVATVAIVSSPGAAQLPGPSPPPVSEQPTSVRLSLGDAARLAASQSAIAQGARLRADEAQARVRQRRADLLPTLSSYVQEAGRTFNTSTLGIDFPTPPSQPPVFDPKGQVEGPVNTLDVRGRVQQNLLDFAALGRVRSAQAQLDLLRSLALSVGTDLVLTDSLSPAAAGEPLPDEATLVAQALRNRPDLVAEEERLRAAKQGVSAIKAERLPSLGLVADDGVIGKNGAKMLNTYTWGLQVTLPIFDGFRREARLQEQQSVVKEAEIRRRDLEQQAQADVRGALIDLAAAREQLDAATERLRFAEQELAQARDRFNAGVAGNADVVNASLALTASRTLVNDAETAYQLARVALARATGSVTTLR